MQNQIKHLIRKGVGIFIFAKDLSLNVLALMMRSESMMFMNIIYSLFQPVGRQLCVNKDLSEKIDNVMLHDYWNPREHHASCPSAKLAIGTRETIMDHVTYNYYASLLFFIIFIFIFLSS